MNSCIEIYLHFVWATWDRMPLIERAWERALWRELQSEVVKQNCKLLAMGGTDNHVHMLVKFRSTLTVAEFIKQVKGASSLFVNDTLHPTIHFKWQGSYGAFSVGRAEVPGIVAYIKNQRAHHAKGTEDEEMEKSHTVDLEE